MKIFFLIHSPKSLASTCIYEWNLILKYYFHLKKLIDYSFVYFMWGKLSDFIFRNMCMSGELARPGLANQSPNFFCIMTMHKLGSSATLHRGGLRFSGTNPKYDLRKILLLMCAWRHRLSAHICNICSHTKEEKFS